ncbi:MAG TPA: tetratricopeptide repeat protein [Novosphingobium sp.]|nr:tetratricopeptide repeat protein [Novosphingobium sp.]
MTPPLRLVLPLAALIALTSCGESPEALFASAREQFAAENYQQARLDLSQALRERPGDRAMLELLVDTHLRMGDADGAEGALGRLERAGGGAPARMKAELALMRGDPRAALALLGADASPDGWRVRAESLVASGEPDAARDAFAKGMARGGNVRLGAAYGRFLLLDEDLPRAAALLQRMQAMAPKSYETLVMAGDLAVAQGRDDVAIAAYRRTVEAFPDRAPPMLALANLYDGQGRIDEASRMVEKAGKAAPSDPEVEEMRFQLLAEKGEWEQIRLALQTRESDLEPGSTLSMTYGEALLRLGHPQQARVIFRRAALVLPGNPYSRLMLGEAQMATGDAQGAWKTLAPLAASTLARPEVLERTAQAARAVRAPEASSLQSRLEPARMKATMALVEQGENALAGQDWKTAAMVYGQLLERGEDPEVLKRLALAKSRSGDPKAAIAYADRALDIDPDNADYLYTAGMARLAAGTDLGGARRLLEAAAAIDPRNRAIARELAKAKAATG